MPYCALRLLDKLKSFTQDSKIENPFVYLDFKHLAALHISISIWSGLSM